MNRETRRHRLVVPPDDAGKRLDVWLTERLPDFSRSAVQRLVWDGHVLVNGRPHTKCGAPVRAGDTIEVAVPPPAPAIPQPQPIPLDILYEDESLLVLNKPAGMVVHPAAGNREGTLVNALLHHCGGLSTVGGVDRPGIVHRLDKLTSGLMAVAKSDLAHRHLTAQLGNRTMKRTYVAVIWGEMEPPAGTISGPIGRHPTDRKRMAIVAKGGRHAVTHYRTLAAAGGLAIVELSLETGRTHQIRVHLSHVGHPVVGDQQYGYRGTGLSSRLAKLPPSLREMAGAVQRQMLHAWRLRFVHPVTGRILEVESPLPDALARIVAAVEIPRQGLSGENRIADH